MYKHILIATDGSELGGTAVATGLQLARHLAAKVTAVTVTEPWTANLPGEAAVGFPIEAYDEAAAAVSARILGDVAQAARKAGIPCATLHIRDQYPAQGIVSAARQNGCDLIVMASHGRRGISRLLLGSVTSRVLALSDVAVLVCR